MTERRSPEYVHAILDALLDGKIINFGGMAVPVDVAARIDSAVAGGTITTDLHRAWEGTVVNVDGGEILIALRRDEGMGTPDVGNDVWISMSASND